MDKKKFDKIMDEWAAQEMEAAPDLVPSQEVYQKLEEKQKKSRFVLFSWPVRLAAAGIAAALITLVIVMQPPKEVEPLLGLRKGTVTDMAGKAEAEDRMQALGETEIEEQMVVADTPDKAKKVEEEKVKEVKKEEEPKVTEYDEAPAKIMVAEKIQEPKVEDKETLAQPQEVTARPRMEIKPETKDAEAQLKRTQVAAVAPSAARGAMPERIEFQYQPKGTKSVEGMDLRLPQQEAISLSSEDNYRLVIQLPEERYVYVYQVGADQQFIRLFPNTEYNPAENPLQAGKTLFVPLPPNWFYVEEDAGEALVYVVTAAEPLRDWDALYTEYSEAASIKNKRDISGRFLDLIMKNRRDPSDQVSVRVFKFNIN
jgi:hypothetical protein